MSAIAPSLSPHLTLWLFLLCCHPLSVWIAFYYLTVWAGHRVIGRPTILLPANRPNTLQCDPARSQKKNENGRTLTQNCEMEAGKHLKLCYLRLWQADNLWQSLMHSLYHLSPPLPAYDIYLSNASAALGAVAALVREWRYMSVCVWQEENRDNSSLVVSAPSYRLHSQKQVYKLIGKCQTYSRLVEHTLTLPARQADKRIGSWRENKRNPGEKNGWERPKWYSENETKGRRIGR